MTLVQSAAAVITLTALFSYVNARTVKLPTMIGVMVIALSLSLGLLAAGRLSDAFERPARLLMQRVDFSRALMQGMLSFLLFAGALRVDLSELHRQKVFVGALATLGVLVSTALVGTSIYLVLRGLSAPTPLADCLLFGALISPTDPIAVLGILDRARAPAAVRVTVVGESLFNDGVGIAAFTLLLQVANGAGPLTATAAARAFALEAGGGAALGLALGAAAFFLLKTVDDYQVEALLTLALVLGGYSLASALGVSAPIAIVAAGLIIGNQGRRLAMSRRTREELDSFWELIDDVLNAVLFVMLGLEGLVLSWRLDYVLAGLAAIPVVLGARAASVGLPAAALRRWISLPHKALPVMIWGGLRGGISVALALSLPRGGARPLLVTMTYCVVVFSIVGQGLTVGRAARRLLAPS